MRASRNVLGAAFALVGLLFCPTVGANAATFTLEDAGDGMLRADLVVDPDAVVQQMSISSPDGGTYFFAPQELGPNHWQWTGTRELPLDCFTAVVDVSMAGGSDVPAALAPTDGKKVKKAKKAKKAKTFKSPEKAAKYAAKQAEREAKREAKQAEREAKRAAKRAKKAKKGGDDAPAGDGALSLTASVCPASGM